ncbi:MAG: NUDIX domain-containing protein [Spirochaetia bacterium]|nr:NUDIX domain-containing protein [Spirochaetia bacterium]
MSIAQRPDRISTAGVAERHGSYFVALRKAGTSIGTSWEFPGGKNREYESPQQTLIREYREEFSVDIAVGKLLFEGSFMNKGTTYRLLAFSITFLDDTPQFKLVEHQKIAWMPIHELYRIPMAESDKAILEGLSDSAKA